MGRALKMAPFAVPVLALAAYVCFGQEKAPPRDRIPRVRPPEEVRAILPTPGLVYHRWLVGEGNHLFRAGADGADEVRLTSDSNCRDPRWSADGVNIAYMWGTASAGVQLHVIRGDGSGDRLVPTGDLDPMYPAWSPDGELLAFTGEGDIWVVRPDGTGLTQLTDTRWTDSRPDWSPSGNSIVYEHPDDPGRINFNLYRMAADGSGQTRLTTALGYDGMARWSRNGRKIAFVSERDGDGEIYVMDPDGSDQTRLTRREGNDHSPCWSGDGSEILWLHGPARGVCDLWAMSADGSDQRLLREGVGTSLDCWGRPRPLPTIRPGVIIRPRVGGD